MDRNDVICQAAGALRAEAPGGVTGRALLDALLARHLLGVKIAAEADPMLGGASARLWLHLWDQPEYGGLVWLRAGLSAERQAFAIAHELGHLVLHRGEGMPLSPRCAETEIEERAGAADLRERGGRVEEYTPRARRELEASAFAAELLAPRDLVRRRFTALPAASVAELAAQFDITEALAQRRLADAVLTPRSERSSRASASPIVATDPMALAAGDPEDLLAALDASQRAAACARGPALVIAGPGTGKTKTLVARVAHLVCERGSAPESILALTFSNRAAGELRERLAASDLPGERMPMMTIHAFAATLLREYAAYVPHADDEPPLVPDFRILDQPDAFLLMEGLLAELPLRHYRSLGNPTRHVQSLLNDFARARDNLLTPAAYLALVDTMPLAAAPQEPAIATTGGKRARNAKPKPPAGSFTAEEIARARERARAYAVWDHALRRRGLLDFGGLIARAVELLSSNSAVLAEVQSRYPHVLVDEFQDTNRAAAELLFLLAGEPGTGLWVVGDRNQSIYRWRGASPANLARLAARYPEIGVHTLRVCYRSVPAIVRTGSAMAAAMSVAAPASEALTPGAALPLALRDALSQPVALVAERADEPAAAPLLRAEDYLSAAHERAGITAAVLRHHAAGTAYREQAVLCRTHAQVTAQAAGLAAAGIPVSQQGDFFARDEVKDALALLALAAGPDARGLLRAPALFTALGHQPLSAAEHHALIRSAVAVALGGDPFPGALGRLAAEGEPPHATLTGTTRTALAALDGVVAGLRYTPGLGGGIARFLLAPGGYAWHLARVADGLERPDADSVLAGMRDPIAATIALGALGELVQLAARFDLRWHSEDAFRQRLSRAVRRVARHRAAPIAAGASGAHVPPPADALEPPPGADIAGTTSSAVRSALPGAIEPDARPLPPPADVATTDEDAPAVTCFLHYLGALRAAGAEITLPSAGEDAVAVLTLHASKGLEFPVVYLPGLAKGRFPGYSRPDDACPPGFREESDAGVAAAEERCLFYVGVTRACDTVVITRAQRYGKQNAQPSPLLALLDDAEDFAAAAPLHTEAELAALSLEDEIAGDPADDDDDDDDDAPLARTADGVARATRHYTLHELQQYVACPRQYKYACVYWLLDPAENAVYRFHRYVRHGMRQLRDLRRDAPDAAWDDAKAQLRLSWETEGPAGHAYDAYYWRHAEEILREEWRHLAAEDGDAAQSVRLAADFVAALPGCQVAVTADRVVPAAASQPEVLVRLHTGRPRAGDEKDLALPLLYLAYKQRHPGAEPRIELAYAGRPLDDATPPGEGDTTPVEHTVAVTDAARACAENFVDPERKRRNRLDKLLEAAAGIAAAQFEPRPDTARCAACAFNTVCPADPDALALAAPIPVLAALE
ncbi:MAG: UvrD-helicase domain-containing protein [Ktedonobacterales bacterium]